MPTLRDDLRIVSDELMSRATELLADLAAVQRVRGMPYAEQLRISAPATPSGMEAEIVKPTGEHASGEVIGITVHPSGSTAVEAAKSKPKLSKGKVQKQPKRVRSNAAQAEAHKKTIISFARNHGNVFIVAVFKREMVAELPAKYLEVGVYSVIRRMVQSKYLKRTSAKGVYHLYARYAKK